MIDLLAAREGKHTDAVSQDRFDRLNHEHAVANIEPMASAEARLAEVHDAAADIGRDLFAAFYRQAPRLRDADELRADRAINRSVMAAAMESEGMQNLRRYTVNDRTQSAIALTTVVDTVTDLYGKLGKEVDAKAREAQDAEEGLQRLLDELEALQAQGDADPGTVAQAEQSAADGKGKAEAARQALDDTLDVQSATIGRAMRRATQRAAEHAEADVEAFGQWGTGQAALAQMDPADRLALARRLDQSRIREIAKLFGALRNLSWSQRKAQYDTLPEEVADVVVGVDDLAWVLPSELMFLADPDLEDEFYRRFVQGELLGYRLRGQRKQAQGGIILCKDQSGSMVGTRDLWASAVGLSLLGVAHDEKRAFHGLCFGGPGVLEAFAFPAPADFTTEKMLAFAESAANPNAGTHFPTPLDAAVQLLDEEHRATGRVTGDIVFVTDGDAVVTASWLEGFKAEQARLGFRVYGIPIAPSGRFATLEAICDGRVMAVRDLTSGADIQDLFRALAATA